MTRMKSFPAVLAFLTILVLTGGAYAQNANQAFENIIDFNRIQPLQNPDFQSASKVLSGRLLDNKNKVVGQVRDVILNENGSIAQVGAEFDRLHLATPVFLNYRAMGMSPVTNGYMVGFEDDRIEAIYPNLLSNIETAAGENSDIFSVNKLIGARVKSESGKTIGRVEDVLFSSPGNRAEALYMALNTGSVRDVHVAIPFGMARFAESGGAKKDVILRDDRANAAVDFAKTK